MPAQLQKIAQVLQFPTPTVDAELEKKLAHYLQLKEQAAAYEKLKKELKPLFEGTEKITVGKFVITGKAVTQPSKVIPSFTYWDMRIKTAI